MNAGPVAGRSSFYVLPTLNLQDGIPFNHLVQKQK
jgi:hypothetical protein